MVGKEAIEPLHDRDTSPALCEQDRQNRRTDQIVEMGHSNMGLHSLINSKQNLPKDNCILLDLQLENKPLSSAGEEEIKHRALESIRKGCLLDEAVFRILQLLAPNPYPIFYPKDPIEYETTKKSDSQWTLPAHTTGFNQSLRVIFQPSDDYMLNE
jgi:hypothetical protein